MALQTRRDRREKQKQRQKQRQRQAPSSRMNQLVIGYNNLSPAEVDQLKSIVRALSNGAYRKIILEPYPSLTDSKVALTSWRWLLKLQSVDDIQVVQFVRVHYSDPNYAPEAQAQ